jgi:hypothetical protein
MSNLGLSADTFRGGYQIIHIKGARTVLNAVVGTFRSPEINSTSVPK